MQFVSPDGRASQPFYFFQHLKHEAANTWQVLRSEFDQILMDNAREKGAEVIEEVTVRETIQENGYVTGVRAVNKANGETLEFHAPITLDATGRDAFSVSRNGWKVRDPYLNKIAIWTYYKGAMRDPGVDEGATTVAYVPEKGWFWYIPLAGDVVSVGIVAEKDYLYNGHQGPGRDLPSRGRQQRLDRTASCGRRAVRSLPRYRRILLSLAPLRRKWTCSDRRCVRVSGSGVFLGRIPRTVQRRARCRCRRCGVDTKAITPPSASQRTVSEMCHGIEVMRRLVYAFYDHAFSFRAFVNKYPQSCRRPHGLPYRQPVRRLSTRCSRPFPISPKFRRRSTHGSPLVAGPVISRGLRTYDRPGGGIFRTLTWPVLCIFQISSGSWKRPNMGFFDRSVCLSIRHIRNR